jgi:uncharacterized protein
VEQQQAGPLRAPLEIGFDYTRSLGPVLSRFMTGLAGRRILGARASDGTVHAPPFEYDPVTLQPPGELTEVGPEGTVASWSWMPKPIEGQPLGTPFGWALIRLDGADTAMLHAVDPGPDGASAMRTGMRVRPRWADAPVGSIRDIECFEPASEPRGAALPGLRSDEARRRSDSGATREGDASKRPEVSEQISRVVTPIRLHYEHTASPGESAYLRGLAEGKLLGQRCPACGKVYIPARGTCPTDGVPMAEQVELPEVGTVTTFCVVNVPYPGQDITPPYVAAAVLLDGADIAFQQLILGCPASEVRMGMRVRAVWKPREQWGTSAQNVSHFAPTGEPDAGYESYARYL